MDCTPDSSFPASTSTRCKLPRDTKLELLAVQEAIMPLRPFSRLHISFCLKLQNTPRFWTLKREYKYLPSSLRSPPTPHSVHFRHSHQSWVFLGGRAAFERTIPITPAGPSLMSSSRS